MKKLVASLLLVGMLAGAGAVYAQEAPNAIALTKIPDLVVDLFSKHSGRQAYDNAKAGSSVELPALCDASGVYTVHYWRTADEVGAIYLDGCIHSDVSTEVTKMLGNLDMASVPIKLLATGQSGTNYKINLFCTGEGQRVTIDASFAH
jgi:hypothetical protein